MGEALAAHLAERAAKQPLSVAEFMEAANAAYYSARDPFGAQGDFITAPEISQMFGELIGLWIADLCLRAGSGPALYVEFGPGRGTLAADALRALAAARLAPDVHFVETSPVLRTAQAARVPDATWHADFSTLPRDRPLLVVANEFFDALPVRQFVRHGGGWHELMISWEDGRFVRRPGPAADLSLGPAREGAIREMSPVSGQITRDLAARIAKQGGAALVIDYGHAEPGLGDTLQAVARHGFVDPLEAPGTRDLTAHVDFSALRAAAKAGGAAVHGPILQGTFLEAMGIGARSAALAASAPARAEEIAAARERLVAPEAMGSLFKAMAITAPGWPVPAAFQ